jgi:hypothetical protein
LRAQGDLRSILTALVGEPVFRRNIAGNTLTLWFRPASDGKPLLGLSLDPPWRVEAQGEIVATSADLPWEQEDGESDAAYRERVDAAVAESESLTGLIVRDVAHDERTGDLLLTLDRGHTVQTFTVWRDEESWRVLDYKLEQRLLVSPGRVAAEKLE